MSEILIHAATGMNLANTVPVTEAHTLLHDSVYTRISTSVGRESRVVVVEDWVWE